LAELLLVNEVIYTEDVEHIFGKRMWVSRSQEIFENKKETEEEPVPQSKPVGSGDIASIESH